MEISHHMDHYTGKKAWKIDITTNPSTRIDINSCIFFCVLFCYITCELMQQMHTLCNYILYCYYWSPDLSQIVEHTITIGTQLSFIVIASGEKKKHFVFLTQCMKCTQSFLQQFKIAATDVWHRKNILIALDCGKTFFWR